MTDIIFKLKSNSHSLKSDLDGVIAPIFSAADRTGYETAEERKSTLKKYEDQAIRTFPGAESSHEALQMMARHQTERLESASKRLANFLRDLETIKTDEQDS